MIESEGIIKSDMLTISPARLMGEVKVSGAKNSTLRLLAASILTGNSVRITNYPSGILDAEVHLEMLRALGKSCWVEGDALTISEEKPLAIELNWEGRSIRNTLLILGCLLTRFGRGAVPAPGGCRIGSGPRRTFDLHLMVLEKLGARVWEEEGILYAERTGKRLKGADIHLPLRSTGATENALLSATLAEGETRIWNPHVRPEILDLVKFLCSMGAEIEVFGQEHILVRGVEELGSATHHVIPDNVEALTWLVGAAISGGEVEIQEFPYEHLEIPLIFLRDSGVKLFRGDGGIVVRGARCYPIEISTGPYPGINSDMQPLLAVYGAIAKGESRFIDLRFPGRYAYVNELAKMGVEYRIDGNVLYIEGGKPLRGATVEALDLRAGAALSLAGLVAEGETRITSAWQIFRGYDRFVEKWQSLGGRAEYTAD